MALPIGEKNKNLKASPVGKDMAALIALKSLNRYAKKRKIVSPEDGPRLPDESVEKHLQGIAVRGDRVFLTTSSRGGKIIFAQATTKRKYTIEDKLVGFHRDVHAGGIQIIGHYLVIPVYGGNFRAIEFRDINDGLSLVKRIKIKRRPYCVGIATTTDDDGEYYVLAVVTDPNGNRVDIYRSPSELLLDDPNCNFRKLRTYKTTRAVTRDSRTEWNGYSNNFSLLSDTKGNVYFLGLYKTALAAGRDYADLYHLDLEQAGDKLFKRLGRIHAFCNEGPAFRWGASASVVAPDSMEIYACEKDVQDNRRIRMDLFS